MANRITHLRKALGGDRPISQAALAALLRVNQSTVSRIENGEPLAGPLLTAIEAIERDTRVSLRTQIKPKAGVGA